MTRLQTWLIVCFLLVIIINTVVIIIIIIIIIITLVSLSLSLYIYLYIHWWPLWTCVFALIHDKLFSDKCCQPYMYFEIKLFLKQLVFSGGYSLYYWYASGCGLRLFVIVCCISCTEIKRSADHFTVSWCLHKLSCSCFNTCKWVFSC